MVDEVTVNFEEADFVEAYRQAPRPRRLGALLLTLALILGLLIIALLVRFPEAREAFRQSPVTIALAGSVIVVVALVLMLLAAAPALRRRVARSTLNDHPGMLDPVHYTFDADHFTMRSTYAEARYPWGQLWDWRETDRLLIVMPTPRNFYLLPKRFIEEAVAQRLDDYLAKTRKRAGSIRSIEAAIALPDRP